MTEIIEGKVTLSFSDTPKVVTGIQKLAQQYAVTLLTELSSVLADPTFGTEPAGLIGISNVNADQIKQRLQIAVFDAFTLTRDSILEEEASGQVVPDDEAITNAEIIDLNINRDRVSVTVKIETRAGTARVYVIPLTTAIGLQQ
jgi:hypothetical protein